MITKNIHKIRYLISIVLTCFLLLSLNKSKKIQQNSFDYSGTNSLFVEIKNDSVYFNWITNTSDSGYYQIKNHENKILKEEIISKNRVHKTAIKSKLDKKLSILFGGKNTEKHRVTIYPKPSLESSYYKKVDSIFVVGDVHGEYDQLINLLINSKIIDSNLNWIAGKSHLVFLGDLFDRGDKVTKVLWFIYELEQKAKKEKGKVHLVLGNHEIMVMSKDLRYISKKEKNISIAHRVDYDYLFHPQNTVLGNWLKNKTSVLKIDQALFAHGGVIDLQNKSIKDFNITASGYIDEPAFLDILEEAADTTRYSEQHWLDIRNFFYSENSPYWYRGYSNSLDFNRELRKILKKYNSKVHVVGHTKFEKITSRYQGKLITTDLEDKATQLLLLVKKKKGYERFRLDSEGTKSKF